MSGNMIAYKISIQLGDGNIMKHDIAAGNVFGAVKFVQDEAAKNGWFVQSLLVEMFKDSDIVDADVREVKAS